MAGGGGGVLGGGGGGESCQMFPCYPPSLWSKQ